MYGTEQRKLAIKTYIKFDLSAADSGAPQDPHLLLRAPPPLGEGHQREHQRAPARLLPEG